MEFVIIGSQRIVSLAPSLTEDLKLLNAEHKLVGITNYCVVESDINVVASAVDINLERIVAVDPDLVLATSLTSKETLDLTIVSLKGGVGNSQTFNSNPCIISNHIQAQIET